MDTTIQHASIANVLNRKQIERNIVGVGIRLRNYLLDLMTIIVITSFIYFLMKLNNKELVPDVGFVFILSRIVSFFYYWALEYAFGATIGKMINNVKVIQKDGKPLSFGRAFKRSLSRFIPGEGFSFFGPKSIGWHDSISNSRVIKN